MNREEERRHPPIVADLYGWWLIRREQRSDWSSERAQTKCSVKDWNEIHRLMSYVKENELYTAEKVMAKLDPMEAEADSIRQELKQINQRLRDIPAIIEAAKTVKRLQPIKDKTMYGFAAQKQNAASAYADELQEYNKAYALLKRLNETPDVNENRFIMEIDDLQYRKAVLQKFQDGMKDDLSILRKIRKCVQTVQMDANIDNQSQQREENAQQTNRHSRPKSQYREDVI